MRITDIALAAALKRAKATGKPQYLNERIGPQGAGSWEIKATSSGKGFGYWRGEFRGTRTQAPLGEIGREFSIAEARAKAHELGRQLREGGLRAAKEARPIATTRGAGGSLEALCEAYAARLEKAGKRRSAQDTRSSFRVHVAPSRLARAHAASIDPDELVALIRAVNPADKPRATDKLRSFLSTAYRAAIAARHDAGADPALAAFGIKTNPLAEIRPIKGGKGKPGERHHSEGDLRAFLRELFKLDSTGADAVKLALWLGGQRAQQTARVRLADVNGGDDIRLVDPKGRRELPRAHWLPLLARAKRIVAERVKAAREVGDEYLFQSIDSKTGKRAHVRSETMNEAVKAARDAATRAGHRWSEGAQGFTLKDLRRTAETLLTKLGVSKDDRAQLLSHGLGGTQSRHYDRYEYASGKRAALTKWSAFLERLVASKRAPG